MPEENYTFERFSNQPFYREVNYHLVAALGQAGLGKTVLDIGAGTGVVTKLLAEAVTQTPGAKVFAVEPSESAIAKAIERLRLGGLEGLVEFIRAKAEEMVSAVRWALSSPADSAFFCNSIHMVEDKEEAVRNVRDLVHPESLFALNSSFFAGAEPPETLAFYKRCVGAALRQAVATMKERGIERKKEDKVAARVQLTPQEYVKLLLNNGFKTVDFWLETVQIPPEGFIAISEYAPFAQGALSGVPIEIAVPCLQANVQPTYDALGITHVPRRWLQMTAVAT